MKKADFDIIFDRFLSDLRATRESGQKEYAHGEEDNVFNNFNRLAGKLKIDRKKVLQVYLEKHLDGIVAAINGHISQREPIEGRIKDACVYLILLHGMFYEEEKLNKDEG